MGGLLLLYEHDVELIAVFFLKVTASKIGHGPPSRTLSAVENPAENVIGLMRLMETVRRI